jgi:hypothetical protein
MLLKRTKRRTQNFLLDDIEVDLGIRFGEHPVPFRALLQAQDVQAVHAHNAGIPQVSRSLWTRPETHPIAKPPKQQPFDGIHFSTLNTPDGRIESISAEFSYQECAINIDLGYPSPKHTEFGK